MYMCVCVCIMSNRNNKLLYSNNNNNHRPANVDGCNSVQCCAVVNIWNKWTTRGTPFQRYSFVIPFIFGGMYVI